MPLELVTAEDEGVSMLLGAAPKIRRKRRRVRGILALRGSYPSPGKAIWVLDQSNGLWWKGKVDERDPSRVAILYTGDDKDITNRIWRPIRRRRRS